jgi:glycosyltransferase involved in cell wall biosynthesis
MQITVVLTTFSDSRRYVNRLPLIKRCLISLKNQIDTNFKIVCADNNSYDDVKTLFLTYFPNDLFVVCDKAKNRSATRNKGTYYSDTPYIIFLDSDCVVYPTFIQNYKTYINNNLKVIQGAFYSY